MPAIFRFHAVQEIDFDVDLREIQGQERLDVLCGFMTGAPARSERTNPAPSASIYREDTCSGWSCRRVGGRRRPGRSDGVFGVGSGRFTDRYEE
ncbi:hypothetical protein O1G22_39695 [Streptomyces camelliae]|uniref:Uncharacterized protein n=1 Tax=Streptomyces camelliae TaxID=3004093 RepID=A0ABY7PFX1_9ACTN|nr:hypothetical protein [Streptomyces sp. HUAS 2-6]WBO69531.1 hypothetical protein O1G22_39695 [Streptomyces sp. HUAS 2-6]